jgi:hypothetical protein
VTGWSHGGETGIDYATVGYSRVGEELWVARYDSGFGDDFASAMALDTAGNVYVTGWSLGDGTDLDFATVKYSQQQEVTPRAMSGLWIPGEAECGLCSPVLEERWPGDPAKGLYRR